MFKNNKKSMLMVIPVSFLIMILMTSSVILNGYSVNNRSSINAYAAVDNKTASLTSPTEGP